MIVQGGFKKQNDSRGDQFDIRQLVGSLEASVFPTRVGGCGFTPTYAR